MHKEKKLFFHPDCTVGPGIAPGLALRLAGYTAGGESHPALKILQSRHALFGCPYYSTHAASVNPSFFAGRAQRTGIMTAPSGRMDSTVHAPLPNAASMRLTYTFSRSSGTNA